MPNKFSAIVIHFIKPRIFGFSMLVFLMLIIGIAPAIDSIILKLLLDSVENSSNLTNENFVASMLIWALVYGVWWEIMNLLWRSYDYFYMKTMPETKAKIIAGYFSHTQKHSHKFFQQNLAGFITNKMLDASRSFDMMFSDFNENLFKKLVSLITALITLYFVKPIFATILAIWLAFFFGLSGYFSSNIRHLSTKWARNRSLISGKIVDAISNIGSVRMYNNMEHEERHLGRFLNNMEKSEVELNWFMLKLRYFLGLSTSIMMFSMIYFLAYLKSKGEVSIGDFALVISLCIAISDDIWEFSQEMGDFFEELGSFLQGMDLLKQNEITDKDSSVLLNVSEGDIDFKNVTFKYKRNNNLFNNKTVSIKAKQKIGLVGYSGSGKTTFINLIIRLFDIESGQILIDGQDIHSVTQESLRDNICIIPQEPILFNRSVMDNIKYGKLSASDEEVYNAAKKAYIYDEIMKLENKFETICGEKGSALSGGQRQRVAIARAILNDAPILILDEATSSLDSITEKLIQDSLNNLMQDKTVLIIAHRLSTLENMDRILVFNKGQIVEDGSHIELLNNNKLYKELWNSQTGGLIPFAKLDDSKNQNPILNNHKNMDEIKNNPK
jgi:ATP-binding cassette, subfamily B, bacterial